MYTILASDEIFLQRSINVGMCSPANHLAASSLGKFKEISFPVELKAVPRGRKDSPSVVLRQTRVLAGSARTQVRYHPSHRFTSIIFQAGRASLNGEVFRNAASSSSYTVCSLRNHRPGSLRHRGNVAVVARRSARPVLLFVRVRGPFFLVLVHGDLRNLIQPGHGVVVLLIFPPN